MEFTNTNTISDSSNNITFLHNPNMVSLDIPLLSMNIPNMVNLNPSQTQNYDTSFNNIINNPNYNFNDMNDMNDMNDINDMETDDYDEDSTNNLGMDITNPFDNSLNINTFLNNTIYRQRNSINSFSNILSDILLENGTVENTSFNDTIIESFNAPTRYKRVISDKGKTQLKEITYQDSENNNEVCCPITQDDFEEGETIVQLPCKHCFNKEAIFKWLENENNCCPVCRFELDDKEIENKVEQSDSSFNFTEESFPPPPEPSYSEFPNSNFAMSSNIMENLTNQLLYESSVTATNQIYNNLFANMLENLQTTNDTINYTPLFPDPSNNLLNIS